MDSLIRKGNKKEKKYDLVSHEYSYKHFWLEVTEVTLAILIAQIIIVSIPWLKS